MDLKINYIISCGASQIDMRKFPTLISGRTDSIFTDLQNDLKIQDPHSLPTFCKKHKKAADILVGELISAWPNLHQFMKTDHNPFGAELSTLYLYFKSGHNTSDLKNARFTLLSSETRRGYFGAYLIQNFLKDPNGPNASEVKIRVIDNLAEKPEDQDNINTAMENLVKTVLSDMKPNKSDEFWKNVLVMTGGFKSAIPAMTLIATLFGLEMVYTFEQSSLLQHLDPMVDLRVETTRRAWVAQWQAVLAQGAARPKSYIHYILDDRVNKRPEAIF